MVINWRRCIWTVATRQLWIHWLYTGQACVLIVFVWHGNTWRNVSIPALLMLGFNSSGLLRRFRGRTFGQPDEIAGGKMSLKRRWEVSWGPRPKKDRRILEPPLLQVWLNVYLILGLGCFQKVRLLPVKSTMNMIVLPQEELCIDGK